MNDFSTKLKTWFIENNTQITWFLIGWLCIDGFHSLGKGDYVFALIDFGLAYLNYSLNKR